MSSIFLYSFPVSCSEEGSLKFKKYLEATERNFSVELEKLEEVYRHKKCARDRLAKQHETEILVVQNELDQLCHQQQMNQREMLQCKDDNDDIEMSILKTKQLISNLKCRRNELSITVERNIDVLKKSWTAFLKSCHLFKSRLQCCVEVLDPKVPSCYFYFFTTEVGSSNYVIQLQFVEGSWSFSEVNPEVPKKATLSKKLAENNDIHGFLYYMHESFKHHAQKNQALKQARGNFQ